MRAAIKDASRTLPPMALIHTIVDMVSDREDLTETNMSALILMLKAQRLNETAERNQWERMRN